MHADEHRLRVNKVEFDVQAIPLDDVDLDRRCLVMRRGLMILSLAALQDIANLLGGHQSHEKHVLCGYVRARRFVLGRFRFAAPRSPFSSLL